MWKGGQMAYYEWFGVALTLYT